MTFKFRKPTFGEKIGILSLFILIGLAVSNAFHLFNLSSILIALYTAGIISLIITKLIAVILEKINPHLQDVLLIRKVGPLNFSLSLFTILVIAISLIVRYLFFRAYFMSNVVL